MSDDRIDQIDALFDEAPLLNEPSGKGELFLPASHMRLLEKLEHLSRYSHFVQIVVGLPGSGKTTLLQQFIPHDDDSAVFACLLNGSSDASVASLLAQLCEQLELPPAGSNSERFKAIIRSIRSLAAIPRQLLIIVDDADQLPEPALALLFKLLEPFEQPEQRPHLVLFGSPQLRATLNGAPFQAVMARAAHLVELEPLNADELQGFLAHRFGAQADALGERELQQLLHDSQGLPGRIPQALEQLLNDELEPRPPVAPRKSGSLSLRFGALGLLIALPLGAALWWFSHADEPAGRLRIELPTPSLSEPVAATPTPVVVEESLEQRLEKVKAALEQEQRALAAQHNALSSTAAASAAAAMADSTAAQAPLEAATAPPSAPAEADTQLPVAALKPVEAASSSAVVATTPPKRVLTLPAAASSALPATAVAAAAKALTPQQRQEQTLLSWEPSGYTLQVLGARRESSVRGFISEQQQPERFYAFSTLYKDHPWYAVVYGNYPTRSAALAAIADLPLELRKRRPWARSVRGVQEDIRRKE